MVLDLVNKIRISENFWYPSCGADLKPIHHVAFNNLYINPRVLLFNDLYPEEFSICGIEGIEKIEIVSKNEVKIENDLVKIFFICIHTDKSKIKKELFFFPWSNTRMYEWLTKNRITIKTVLLHNFNDSGPRLESGWMDIFKNISVKYCYTDNWFNLTINTDNSFRKLLISNGLRYISKQSYDGFKISFLNASERQNIAINNSFDKMIHLFEIKY